MRGRFSTSWGFGSNTLFVVSTTFSPVFRRGHDGKYANLPCKSRLHSLSTTIYPSKVSAPIVYLRWWFISRWLKVLALQRKERMALLMFLRWTFLHRLMMGLKVRCEQFIGFWINPCWKGSTWGNYKKNPLPWFRLGSLRAGVHSSPTMFFFRQINNNERLNKACNF